MSHSRLRFYPDLSKQYLKIALRASLILKYPGRNTIVFVIRIKGRFSLALKLRVYARFGPFKGMIYD